MSTLLRATTLLFLVCWLAFASAAAPKASASSTDVLNRYIAASQQLQMRLRDSSMDIDVDGRLLRLKKEGSLHALRMIGRLGQITFDAASSVGDKTVIKELITRYLTAETDPGNLLKDSQGNVQSIAISQENYKFRYKATVTTDARQVFVFQIAPKKNRVGLFKGEVWVDGETGMPIRESGRFVKSPSKFLRNLDFVRQYEMREGMALPAKIECSVETFLYGKAELSVRYSKYSVLEAAAQSRVDPLDR